MEPVNPNIYHRYLKLPFEYPKPEIFDHGYHKTIQYPDISSVDTRFRIWIESLGLVIGNNLEAFYTPPNGGSISIHSDTPWLPGIKDVCKLNFTWGPSSSVTRWYRARYDSDIILVKSYDLPVTIDSTIDIKEVNIDHSDGAVYFAHCSADVENVDLVYEAVIDRPSLFNSSQLHSTFNPGSEHRWTLSFLLTDQAGELLQFSDALDIFQDYIQ